MKERAQKIIDTYMMNTFEHRFNNMESKISIESIYLIIKKAIVDKDKYLLSIALDVGFHFEIFDELKSANPKIIARMCKMASVLIEQSWHSEHENIVEILSNTGAKLAIEPIVKAVFAKPKILVEMDEDDNLSRRAIWALGKMIAPIDRKKIDSDAAYCAFDALIKLSHNVDPVISERSRKQIERIKSEI